LLPGEIANTYRALMTFDGLDERQSLALISEITSTRNLLHYGTEVVESARFTDTTRDPIMTLLSIGFEKLFKLTVGIAALEREGVWPTRKLMKTEYGHQIVDLHAKVMAELQARASMPHVQALVADVAADPVIAPLMAALDRYAQEGRFYTSDLLAGHVQKWEDPRESWQTLEDVLMKTPYVAPAYATALADPSDNTAWDVARTALNARLARSILGLWTMIAVCGQRGLLGRNGALLGHDIHPSMTGRR
jgi:hypothetical protein